MRGAWVALTIMVAGCGSAATASPRTLPDPIIAVDMPDEVQRPDEGVQTVAVDSCVVTGGEEEVETGPGVLFPDESAAYVARLRVSYDEVRGLYEIDQRTWERERQIYTRHLEMADEEIQRANERAERTWWELHGDEVGLIGGFVVGVAVTIGIVAAVDATTTGI